MIRSFFKKVCIIISLALLLSFVGCAKVGFNYNSTGGGGASSENGDGEEIVDEVDDGSKETEKKTEKKTEKNTEKKTEKKTEKTPLTFKLKVGTYNIYHAGNNKDLTKIAKNITDNKLDIVGLQEVDNNTKRSGKINQVKKLSELTGYKYYHFFKAINHDGGEYGTAILSKYPIESSNKINLSSGSAEQRVLGHCVINVNDVKINFFVTHLSYDGEGGGSSRSKQFSEVAAELAKYDNFILSGDFNTRNLDEYNVIKNSALVNNKENETITYPDGRSPLDNLVYSTSVWSFDKINVVTNSYSDHYMVWTEFTYTEKIK